MAGNPDEWPQVIAPGAFDGHLPASVPVRGLDGELIEGAVADVRKDDTGLAVTIHMPGSADTTGHIPTA